MMLLMNGDITYSCSKQGFNMFLNKKDQLKNLIRLEDLVEVQAGKANSLTFVKSEVTKGKVKHVKYTFAFESMHEA